jgi:hypothetical protein
LDYNRIFSQIKRKDSLILIQEQRQIIESLDKCFSCTLYEEEFISSSVVMYSLCMFNLTNVGLSMCVLQFIRFISEFEDWMRANPGMHVPSKNYLNGGESLWYSRTTRKVCNYTRIAGKSSEKIPTLWVKVGIMLMLDNPT